MASPSTKQHLAHANERPSPVRPYRVITKKPDDPGYLNRLLIATPTTGHIRFEWAAGRFGQIIPMNWSAVNMEEWYASYAPVGFPVADAQNMIVKAAIENDFEWLLLIEHDVILPPSAFITFNRYIRDERTPIVSGLYYSRSRPSEPMIFRGRGNSVYDRFKLGELVWCDGVPTGALLIHMGILREMWKDSPEYSYRGQITRRVFEHPVKIWFDPESGQYNSLTGTTDLEWCTRVMEGGYFKRAGWDEFAKKKWPFLVDTNIFCKHINLNGEIFP